MSFDVRRIAFVGFILLASCDNDDDIKRGNDLEAIFDEAWNEFDRTYSYFEIKEVDWDSLYAANRPKIINGQTTPLELAEILGEMTLLLKDLHVQFVAGSTVYQYKNRNDFAANSPENAVNYLSAISSNTNTLIIGDIDDSNLQYLRFKNLSRNGNFQSLESVINNLADKDGLVLDLRDNGGGNEAIAKDFVNRITRAERTYQLVRFRNGPARNDFGDWIEASIIPENSVNFEKPIVVLINRGVASSAESFVHMLKTLPNTTLIGDTTRGSSGNPGEFTLPNGWKYRVSRWQVVGPDFSFVEDKGIAPDFVIDNTEESIAERKDLILEKAIELIQ